MYLSAGENIPSLWGSSSLGEATLAMLFGSVVLFALFAFSLANSLSTAAFVALHRASKEGSTAVIDFGE
jgi:hypothetical protein